MIDIIFSALGQLADPTMLIYLLAGVAIGIIIGVIPGLGGTGAVAVLMPFIFMLEPNQAIAMIIGAVAVVHTSDVITSVVLGIPGSASASVFLLDGYKMAQQGEGARALSASFIASTIGGLFGIVALTLVVPIAKPIVTSFGSPEIFSLIIAGVFLTAMLSKGNMVKGLLVAAFGLALGFVGVSPISAEYRFTFGAESLADGLDLVVVALGIFGLAEMISLIAQKTAIANQKINLGAGWKKGLYDILKYPFDILRGSAVGTAVGFLPGVGSTAGSWLAYGQAQAFASRKGDSQFGNGDIRGVIAPSAASNGIESGALIPTLIFGVPGAAPFALLLGVLLVFGIQPGPQMMTKHLDLVYFIVWTFALASIAGAVLSFVLARPLARLSFVPFPILAAALIPILFMSGFQKPIDGSAFYMMLAFGLIGWLCKTTNIPRAPFLIAFVLAEPLERYFFLTVKVYEPSEWLTRPFVMVVIAILVGAVIIPIIKKHLAKKNTQFNATAEAMITEAEGGEATGKVRLLTSVAFLGFFVFQFVLSLGYSGNGSLFPKTVGIVGIGLGILSVVLDIAKNKAHKDTSESIAKWRHTVLTVAASSAWVLGFIWLVFAVGMLAGTAIFAIVFLLMVARMKLIKAIIYTIGIVGFIWTMENLAYMVSPVGYLQIMMGNA
ncbi:tripartite tricarboxylate transporter permease [Moraxella cuniculi]|uniref:Tripartite tricarboxylate transporter TctA family n=1 Tax=Moraxella cuniculi TaxID=34061 RepID=A0A3S5EFT1_9GAMM|nr:tripartite tricarboxylate transporter permease [Moraxella cuniculi]VEG12313.1 Tripartite tricarboxylate transporter TctA family [Moraxella cuniculi]